MSGAEGAGLWRGRVVHRSSALAVAFVVCTCLQQVGLSRAAAYPTGVQLVHSRRVVRCGALSYNPPTLKSNFFVAAISECFSLCTRNLSRSIRLVMMYLDSGVKLALARSM